MDFSQALKRLGLSGRPDVAKITRKWKILARQYHPDIAAQNNIKPEEALRRMTELNEAKAALLSYEIKEPVNKALMAQIYAEAQKMVPVSATPFEAEEILVKLIKKYRKDIEKSEYAVLAMKRIQRNKESKEMLMSRAEGVTESRMRELAQEQTLNDDDYIVRQAEKISMQIQTEMLFRHYMMKLRKWAAIARNKKLPVHVEAEKPHSRWIPVTLAFAAGIALGWYYMNKRTGGLQRRQYLPKR